MKAKSEQSPDLQNLSLDELEEQILNVEAYAKILFELKTQKSRPTNSLATFCEDYLEILRNSSSQKYVKSVDRTLKNLMNYFGHDKSISEIELVDANKFIAKLKENAPRGYRVYYRNLKAAFNVALDLGYIEVNPFMKVKLPKQQKKMPAYISVGQLDLILKAMTNETLKAIVHYAFFTGSRRGEILNLRWRNIDFDAKMITIGDEDFTTKTRSQRQMPMADVLYTKLWEWSDSGKKSLSNPDGLVFAKPTGFAYHEDVPTKAFKRACRKAGVDEKIHFHSLRHSFASFLVQKNVELYKVQKLLGHSSITTTEIYSHLNNDALKESVKVFDELK